jgi:serine/threonine-protein kinase
MGSQKAKMKIACPSCRQKLDVSDVDPFATIICPRCGGDVIAPKLFGTLLLEEPLGQRHGVSAYRALDLTLDREVLVKILDAEMAALGGSFQALARQAAAVNHSGVVPVYSCGAEGGVPYLVTQFMSGGALRDHLSEPLPSPEAIRRGLEWSRSVAAGLQAAAAQGVVHGAVTPLSILLDGEGRAKLTDFGLETLLVGASGGAAAYACDVAAYLSPEVLNGSVPTTASDVFGLGAVLYHVLCGSSPCGLGADGEIARRLWFEGQRPKLPSAVNPAVPTGLAELCMGMLEADPHCRPALVAELVQSLTSRAPTRTVIASPLAARRSTGERLAGPCGPLAAEGSRPRREGWMNALIFGGFVAALVLGIALYVRTGGYPFRITPVQPSVSPPLQAVPLAPSPSSGAAALVSARRGTDERASVPESTVPAAPTAPTTVNAREGTSPPPADAAASAAPGGDNLRLYTAGRPRPEGLDFVGASADLARYLRDLPADVLAGERERLDLIGDTRDYLVRLMKYVPYMDSNDSDIRLRTGPPLRGNIPYCNDRQVAVRVRGDNVLHLVPWRDLAIEQVVAFLDYYTRVRSDQGPAADGSGNGLLRAEVAADCLRTAVLCDWYGRPEDARRYARLAVDADPAAAARVRRLLPTIAI